MLKPLVPAVCATRLRSAANAGERRVDTYELAADGEGKDGGLVAGDVVLAAALKVPGVGLMEARESGRAETLSALLCGGGVRCAMERRAS